MSEPGPASGANQRLSRRALAALGCLALVARTFNLPLVPFSLWLDEILILERAAGTPLEILRACLANAEHPPLVAFVLAIGRAAGFSETAHRIAPILLGTATCLLLAVWTARRWGRSAGLGAGVAAALAPYAVRFSQEIRPYPFLGFFVVAALVLADRFAERPSRRRWLALAGVCVAGFYTHVLFGLTAVVLFWPAFEDLVRRRRPARPLLGVAAAFATALLLYLPWTLVTIGRVAERAAQGDVANWTLRQIGLRWQFLTVGGVEREPITWGAFLWLAVALAGAALALLSTAGRAALAAILVGTVGVEIALASSDHWTAGRYDFFGWLFLPVLAGVAWSWKPGRLAPPLRLLRAAVALGFIVGCAAGLARYARVGRPDWRAVVATIRDIRHRAGERVPVWVLHRANGPVVEYYLRLTSARPERIRLRRDHASLDEAIDRSEPVILVTTIWLRNVEPSISRPAARLSTAGRFERAHTRVLTTPDLAPPAVALDPEPPAARLLRSVERLAGRG